MQPTGKQKTEMKKTGGSSPTQDDTPAEELALSDNEGRPLIEGEEGGVSSNPAGVAPPKRPHLYRVRVND